MLPSHFYWLAAPGLPGSSVDRIIAALEKSPPRTKGRGMHHYVKNAVASQTVQYSPPGQPWGLGHDALISVTSRAVLLKETLCIFLAALLPRYEINLRSRFTRRQQLDWAELQNSGFVQMLTGRRD